jgi:hypothetical protein
MTTRIAIFSGLHGNSAASAAVLAAGLPDHFATDLETGGAK